MDPSHLSICCQFPFILILDFIGVTCVSISALVVDAHRVLTQQELYHLQVFSIGARTMEEIRHHLRAAALTLRSANYLWITRRVRLYL